MLRRYNSAVMLFCGVAGVLAAGSGMAEAATRTATFSVSVTITAGCTTTVTGSASTFTVSCTHPAPYAMGWDGPIVSDRNPQTRPIGDPHGAVTATVTY